MLRIVFLVFNLRLPTYVERSAFVQYLTYFFVNIFPGFWKIQGKKTEQTNQQKQTSPPSPNTNTPQSKQNNWQ